MFKKLLLTNLILMSLLVSCKKVEFSKPIEKVNRDSFFSTMEELKVEVLYETGAEPYAGNFEGKPIWNTLENNIQTLFSNRSVSFNIPKTIGQMSQIPNQGRSSWNSNDITSLVDTYKIGSSTSKSINFVIVYVNGNSVSGSGIVGTSYGDTRIIAIFKDVIRSSVSGGLLTRASKKYEIEQSVLIHEVGHALGLVNNGVPMQVFHEDNSHRGHDSNDSCIMYWAIETSSGISDYLGLFTSSTLDEIQFCQNSINDIRSYFP